VPGATDGSMPSIPRSAAKISYETINC
jgi:hypothetical protein